MGRAEAERRLAVWHQAVATVRGFKPD